jgi:glycosyltransferase involved in cell wall biosynthesis
MPRDRVPRDRLVSIQTTNERGGAEYANVDLLDALAARGHDVVLLTNVPDIASGTRVPAVAVDLGPKLARRSVWRVAWQAPMTLMRIARALRAQRPVGVVLVHFKKEQLLLSLLPRALTGRIVWAEWGPVPPSMRRGPSRLAYALAARRARRVVAVSEGTRRTVIDAGVPAKKVTVIPNLLDVESVNFDPAARSRLRAAWNVGEETFVVGCISRFQRRKRNDVPIDAMAHVEGDVLLVLAGEGEEESGLRKRAEPYGERVRFEPNVRGHVEEFLSACDLLVFAPSPTEGAPRVIVMAQLVGVPVVATDVEGAEGLIPAGGGTILARPHDPRALAGVIESYRADPERRRREGELARQATRASHDPERTLRAFEDALGL